MENISTSSTSQNLREKNEARTMIAIALVVMAGFVSLLAYMFLGH